MSKYADKIMKDFISENKEALIVLSDKLNEANKIKGNYDKYNYKSRELAIKIVEEWMRECFGIAYSNELLPPVEEDNLYRRLNKERQESN